MEIARINPDTQAVTVLNMAPAEYAAIQAHPTKAARHRPIVTDPVPAVDPATQVVEPGNPLYAIEPAQVRRTWAVRAKTADELETDALSAELAQVDAILANIDTQNAVTNAQFNAMSTSAKFDVLRADRNHLLRAVKFLLRMARKEG